MYATGGWRAPELTDGRDERAGVGRRQRTVAGSLRTTTLATSKSSSSMNAASPAGPRASGMAVAPVAKVPT